MMIQEQSKTQAEIDIGDFYREIHSFKTRLDFIDHEVSFLHQLINSYTFQPDTKNLFERLQLFEEALKQVRTDLKTVKKRLSDQENILGGMLECREIVLNREFYNVHETLIKDLNDFTINTHEIKMDIYQYITGMLRKKKP